MIRLAQFAFRSDRKCFFCISNPMNIKNDFQLWIELIFDKFCCFPRWTWKFCWPNSTFYPVESAELLTDFLCVCESRLWLWNCINCSEFTLGSTMTAPANEMRVKTLKSILIMDVKHFQVSRGTNYHRTAHRFISKTVNKSLFAVCDCFAAINCWQTWQVIVELSNSWH